MNIYIIVYCKMNLVLRITLGYLLWIEPHWFEKALKYSKIPHVNLLFCFLDWKFFFIRCLSVKIKKIKISFFYLIKLIQHKQQQQKDRGL